MLRSVHLRHGENTRRQLWPMTWIIITVVLAWFLRAPSLVSAALDPSLNGRSLNGRPSTFVSIIEEDREQFKSEDESKLTSDPSETAQDITFRCPADNSFCESDRYGFEAISLLHSQIDDDRNGNLDREESTEFIRDDLKYEINSPTDFHGSDDLITVQDLWLLWVHSKVYNWTVDDVVDWLVNYVELPQYENDFRLNDIDGHMLPRLASSIHHPLFGMVGVKNPIHRQKLSLKSTDVVLFGPPKFQHSYFKDFAVVVSLAIATAGCYFAYVQHKSAQEQLRRVMKDLNTLQTAEDALAQLQKRLDKAQKEQQKEADSKQDLERKLKSEIVLAKVEADRLRTQRETLKEEWMFGLKLAEDELVHLRMALMESEKQLEDRQRITVPNLQQWLQLTYEVETRHFDAKKEATEQKLKAAKEMCEKIRCQKSKFLGAFQVAHTASIDKADSEILSVRASLEDVKMDLQERTHRWKEIENVCGFNITTNPGIPYLNMLLRGGSGSHSPDIGSSTDPGMDEDSVSNFDQNMARSRRVNSSNALRHAMTVPGFSSHQVLSNLLQAGMQLSVVGVNNPAMHDSKEHAGISRTPFSFDSNSSLNMLPQISSAKQRLLNSSYDRSRIQRKQKGGFDQTDSESSASTSEAGSVVFDIGGDFTSTKHRTPISSEESFSTAKTEGDSLPLQSQPGSRPPQNQLASPVCSETIKDKSPSRSEISKISETAKDRESSSPGSVVNGSENESDVTKPKKRLPLTKLLKKAKNKHKSS